MELANSVSATSPAHEAPVTFGEVQLWYHSHELPGGVTTPGWFDLRPIVDRMPWPDVRGKRCLDVGTYDGFLAFELERRGAAEVVATDIADHTRWDWPPHMRTRGPEVLAQIAGPDKGAGFRAAHAALGSSVQRVECSIYDIGPELLGMFDVVVCGTLLLHLRDPLRGLEALRSVCSGHFLSAEEVRIRFRMLTSRRPLLELDGTSDLVQWLVPSPAAHVRLLEAAGFRIDCVGCRYSVPFGVAHPRLPWRARLAQRTLAQLAGWGPGVPHHAVLARPA